MLWCEDDAKAQQINATLEKEGFLRTGNPGLDLSGVTGVPVVMLGRQRQMLLWLLLHPLLVSRRECKRTQGVSTTDLVGRMLLMTKAHHSNIVSQRALGGRWSTGHVPALPSAAPNGVELLGLAPRCMENGQW